jgi:hypothetical protein
VTIGEPTEKVVRLPFRFRANNPSNHKMGSIYIGDVDVPEIRRSEI